MLLPTHPLPPLAVLCLELGYTLVTFYSLSTVVGYLLWLNEDTPSIFIEGDTP